MTDKNDNKKNKEKARRLTPSRIRLHRFIWKPGTLLMHLLMLRRYRFQPHKEHGLPDTFLMLSHLMPS